MNFFRKLFALYLDEVPAEGAAAEPVKGEQFNPLTPVDDAGFAKLDSTQQELYMEKTDERRAADVAAKAKDAGGAADETVDDDDDDDDDTPAAEVDEDDDEPAVDEDDDEPAAEEVVEEVVEESPEVTKKRLTDTQAAFRKERARVKQLEKDLEAAKKPAAAAPAAAAPAKKEGEPEPLTLLTIPQDVLLKSLKEKPVETQRWIADQQVKLSLKAQEEANAKVVAENDKQNRVANSETSAFKKFPVLQELLDMEDKDLADLKTKDPSRYAFGKKTVKYYKEFAARGDEEALYNAATRAYVELSPEMIKKIQIETKNLAKQEFATKKKVLGKVGATPNKGAIGASKTVKHKTLSDAEFMNLSPADQDKFWAESVEAKQAKQRK